ncbi:MULTISPECIES: lysoplasmalogenase family protein [Ramlibacter]|uniref:Sterol desaturase family protein n=1 Tax=Ramlibacter aquaticus TaxID=2780094 RepID=A0ABR9SAM1_9BURK|nr:MULTISPECIES: lysoplasmalogenase family protein [Ramlibacter]MBE7939127.1 sterol desaturase family protein [Ramlibacter aquaticus]
MSPSQVIVLATPVFLALIALEYAWGRWRGRDTYGLPDTLCSISLGLLSQVSAALAPLLTLGLYASVQAQAALWRNDAFWLSPAGWGLALLAYDFLYYWLHRAGHEVALLWAAHVVHHQSEHYNLSTALRQTSTGPLLAWVFYLPMALAGVPPLVFAVVALVDLLYQFWVHTEHVGRLGGFDRWFCSPSNHRVHHAVNEGYVDRNYGGILMVWDRMFGTFVEETEPCVYGTRSPLRSCDPLWANLEVYGTLARLSWQARSPLDKLRVWFKPPGWLPPELRDGAGPFDLSAVRRWDPPMAARLRPLAGLLFLAHLGAAALFLWQVDALPAGTAWAALAGLVAASWALGALLQGRLGALPVLALQAAALATVSSAAGWGTVHQVAKPAALLLLMACVVHRLGVPALRAAPGRWLAGGLLLSLAGDVLLMLPGHFVGGLVAFLLAHLCYIAALRDGAGWLPRPLALAATLAYGAAMLAFLFPTLPPALRMPVSAYVAVIALMAAQALGRAAVLGGRDAAAVGLGALLFMASDSLLAVNRFALALPLAPLWVLSTYYGAQWLIAMHFRPQAQEKSSPALLGGATPR